MENTKLYEIGEVVTWEPSPTVKCVGLVFDDLGKETVNVLCVDINGRKAKTKIDVQRSLMKRYDV